MHVSPPFVGPHTPQAAAVQAKAPKFLAVRRGDNLHDYRVRGARAYIIGQAQDPDPASDVLRRVALLRDIEHFTTDRDAPWLPEREVTSESNETCRGSLTPIVCVDSAGPKGSDVQHVILNRK